MSCEKSCEKSCEESCEESCVLEGHVHRYDPSGWLELGGFRYGDGEMVDQNALVYIFGSSASETDLFHESLLGSFIAITEAHPVRLWGSLAGFCTGIRSTISMSPHMRRKRSRRLPGEFRALCGELYSSSLFREQCVMFRLWAATSCGRVRSAVPPSWPQPEDGAIGQVLSAVLIRADQSLFRMPAEALRAASTSDFLFYAIKAGHDEDWLCSQLPEIMNCRHVLKVAGRMCKRNGGGCANAVDCRASLGLCGRQNATMDLVFASCVIGSVTAIDPAGTRLTLSDRSGAVLSVYVTGGRAAHPVGSRHVMAVVSDPCLLVEEKVGFPPIILLLCPADRIKFVTCESPVEGKVGHLLCQPSTELVTASYLSASALTVRRALAATAGPTPTWGSNVVGVVVFKELVLSNLSHHAAGRVAPQHAAGSKFLVVMRDKDYADCISAFVEAGAAADAVIGSVICIQNCNIRMSKTQKNLYIEFDRNKGSSLGKCKVSRYSCMRF